MSLHPAVVVGGGAAAGGGGARVSGGGGVRGRGGGAGEGQRHLQHPTVVERLCFYLTQCGHEPSGARSDTQWVPVRSAEEDPPPD